MPSALAVRSGVEPAQPGGGGGRAEDPADRGRMEAALVEEPRRGHADPRHDLVRGDHDRRERRRGPTPRSPPPAASEAGQVTTLTCATESECVSSKSRPWQTIALAKAALAAGRPASADDGRLVGRLRARPSCSRPSVATPERGRGEPAAQRVEQVELGRLGHLRRNRRRARARSSSRRTCCAARHLRPSSLRRCRETRRSTSGASRL